MCDLRKCADTETAVMSELRESEIAKVPVARLFVIAGALVIAGAGCHCGCRLSLRVPAVIAGAGCHCGCRLSLRATTRNPVRAYHWIPDRVRDDICRVRDDIKSGMTNAGSGMTTVYQQSQYSRQLPIARCLTSRTTAPLD
jgi:hypothetical protein